VHARGCGCGGAHRSLLPTSMTVAITLLTDHAAVLGLGTHMRGCGWVGSACAGQAGCGRQRQARGPYANGPSVTTRRASCRAVRPSARAGPGCTENHTGSTWGSPPPHAPPHAQRQRQRLSRPAHQRTSATVSRVPAPAPRPRSSFQTALYIHRQAFGPPSLSPMCMCGALLLLGSEVHGLDDGADVPHGQCPERLRHRRCTRLQLPRAGRPGQAG
jgi:hypothetical protein